MTKMETKNFNAPDEVKQFEKGRQDIVKIGGATVLKGTFQPGWRWTTHVGPIAKTPLDMVPHFQYLVSGTLHVVMADGTGQDIKAGEVSMIPPGHDAWVVGASRRWWSTSRG
jgi:hypothetical protein